MATYTPAKRATEFIMYVSLGDTANAGLFKANPTIAAGDFQVSKDGGTLANLTTLPTVTPASGKLVKITLSVLEMTADNVSVVCSDAAGAEWDDLVINIHTAANQFDDLSTFDPATDTVDVGKLSGDATAADNAEAFFDGTGYAGTGNTIPTVTNLTNAPTSGDLTATMKASVNAEVDTAITDAALATAASIAALNDPTAAAVVSALMAHVIESGKTVDQALLDIWAVTVGDSAANDGTTPTSLTYDSPDGTVQRTHSLTATTRTVS